MADELTDRAKLTVDEQMGDIASKVSKRYARVCLWTDRADLEQQAWVVLLEFKQRWAPRNPSGEIDRSKFGNFAHRTVVRQLSRYTWRVSSPVYLSDHACGAEATRGFRRVELDTLEPCESDETAAE